MTVGKHSKPPFPHPRGANHLVIPTSPTHSSSPQQQFTRHPRGALRRGATLKHRHIHQKDLRQEHSKMTVGKHSKATVLKTPEDDDDKIIRHPRGALGRGSSLNNSRINRKIFDKNTRRRRWGNTIQADLHIIKIAQLTSITKVNIIEKPVSFTKSILLASAMESNQRSAFSYLLLFETMMLKIKTEEKNKRSVDIFKIF